MLDPEPGSQVSAELIRILYRHTEVYVTFQIYFIVGFMF
jgi:hypothetical protein